MLKYIYVQNKLPLVFGPRRPEEVCSPLWPGVRT